MSMGELLWFFHGKYKLPFFKSRQRQKWQASSNEEEKRRNRIAEEEQPAYLNNETSKVMWCFPTGLSGRCFIASSINHTGKWCHYYIVGSLAARIRFSQIYLWDNIFEKHKTIGHVTWLTFNNKNKTRVASSFSLIIYYSLSRLPPSHHWFMTSQNIYIFIYSTHHIKFYRTKANNYLTHWLKIG